MHVEVLAMHTTWKLTIQSDARLLPVHMTQSRVDLYHCGHINGKMIVKSCVAKSLEESASSKNMSTVIDWPSQHKS